METKKINLEEILKSRSNICFDDYEGVITAMKEACRQTLELAVDNANLAGVPMNNDKLHTVYVEKLIERNDNTDDYMYGVNMQSILETIKQVE